MATTALASKQRASARRRGAPSAGSGGGNGGEDDEGVEVADVETNGLRPSPAFGQPRHSAAAISPPRPKYRYVTSVHSKYVAFHFTWLGLTQSNCPDHPCWIDVVVKLSELN